MTAIGIKKVRKILGSRPDRHQISLANRRAAMDAMGSQAELPSDIVLQTLELGGVKCEILSLKKDPLLDEPFTRSILYVHGGAFVAGSPKSHRGLGIAFCREVKAKVIMLDYRLAPENPFPAAITDVISAYREMRSSPDKFGPIAMVGDSAGAGALISALMVLRDKGDKLPEVAACISPWLDLSCSFDSYTRLADSDPFLSKEGLEQDAASFLGGTDPKNPLASPIFADPKGLPTMLIQVGSEEILIDEIVEFTENVTRAGGNITLEIWPEMIHVFHGFSALLPDGVKATKRLGQFISENLGQFISEKKQ
ncbi:MAG: alpha/beta hydrolase [Pseudomonadales bacterium]|nr:alpha/beta hydrolase [Pseudomonadales bacterium]